MVSIKISFFMSEKNEVKEVNQFFICRFITSASFSPSLLLYLYDWHLSQTPTNDFTRETLTLQNTRNLKPLCFYRVKPCKFLFTYSHTTKISCLLVEGCLLLAV